MIDIQGFEGRYAVTCDGEVWSHYTHKFLKHKLEKNGYHRVTLSSNGVSKTYLIHRLVNAAFNDNPDNKRFTNHIDGDKANNRCGNLEHVTRSENMRHAIDTGLIGYVDSNKNGRLSGEGNGRSKITQSDVDEMRLESTTRKTGDTPWGKYGISRGQYDQIIHNRSWKDPDNKCVPNTIRNRPSGENNPRAKLNWGTVNEIRTNHKNGSAGTSPWKNYGVHKVTYGSIINNETWKV